MTATKEQEFKALEKIRKIVEELGGPESYIGMAFDGCFEIAEDNIKNDSGCSMKQRWETAAEQAKAAQEEIEKLKAEIQQLRETGRWNCDQADQARADAEKERRRADAAEAEIIKLKAKLYDMIAGA